MCEEIKNNVCRLLMVILARNNRILGRILKTKKKERKNIQEINRKDDQFCVCVFRLAVNNFFSCWCCLACSSSLFSHAKANKSSSSSSGPLFYFRRKSRFNERMNEQTNERMNLFSLICFDGRREREKKTRSDASGFCCWSGVAQASFQKKKE